MADRTTIEWTDATWNPIRGCTRVSEGCRNCYAEIMAARFSDPGQWGHGIARRVKLPDGGTDHRWTGKLELIETRLDQPLRWRAPRRIFVNSTSDLFHEAVPDEWIDRVFAVMALSPQHVFQVLTKRPERAQRYLERAFSVHLWSIAAYDMGMVASDNSFLTTRAVRNPLPHIWLGTSIEDQPTADARIPHLLATPAAVRFVSAEPLLGLINPAWLQIGRGREGNVVCALTGRRGLRRRYPDGGYGPLDWSPAGSEPRLDWVIVGGESGPGARVWPGFEDAARSLRDQCRSANVAFFMKQMAGPRKATMPPITADLMVREFPNAV